MRGLRAEGSLDVGHGGLGNRVEARTIGFGGSLGVGNYMYVCAAVSAGGLTRVCGRLRPSSGVCILCNIVNELKVPIYERPSGPSGM